MYVLSIKVPIRKKSGNLLKAPRIYIKQIKPFIKLGQLGYFFSDANMSPA